MSLDWDTILDRVFDILQEQTDPGFTVIAGQRVQLPADGGPFACFWYAGDQDPDEGEMSLSNRMNAEKLTVELYWHPRVEPNGNLRMEKDVAKAVQAIRGAFWGDYTLSSNCSYLEVGRAQEPSYGYFPLQSTEGRQALFYRVEMELRIIDLEGEAIVG